MKRQFQAKLSKNWDDFFTTVDLTAPDWAATPFQTHIWLRTWVQTIGVNTTALPIIVYEFSSNIPILLLPLVSNVSTIEPADLGVTDYNAPIIKRNLNLNKSDAIAIWKAIKSVLPPSLKILITKIPLNIDGEINPLCLLANADKSPLNGNLITIGAEWNHYVTSLGTKFRRELERSQRVFNKNTGAHFCEITELNQALSILHSLEQKQSARMAELGADYTLDKPEIAHFYRNLVASGIANKTVRLTAMMVGDEVVSALLGVTNGKTYAMIRLASGDLKWRNISPGRMVIYNTMETLHSQGFRNFDFTIGDYDYKRRIGAQFIALCTIVEARSLTQFLPVLIKRLRFRLQRSPTWQKIKKSRKR